MSDFEGGDWGVKPQEYGSGEGRKKYPVRVRPEMQNAEHPECSCLADDVEACIRGVVYGYCTSAECPGVCESSGICSCPLHSSPTHHPAYGSQDYSA